MVAELQSVVADLMASIRPVEHEPMRVVEDVCEDLAVRRVVGRCPAGCIRGWVVEERPGGYEVTRPCGTCAAVASQAQRFTAARFPAWALRVRREWTGSVSLGDIDRVAADVAGGRGRVWHGQNGVGKSWTAAAVALSLVESVSVRWLHWPTMVARMKDEVAGGGQLGPLVVKLVGTPRILVVDELAGRRTEFEAELAERIIGPRAESGAVVITTNMTADHCRGYVGDRVWSRLGASCRIGEMGGSDRRRGA
jgi:hypothetical protein